MTGLAELLATCDARGIRLLPAGDGGLTIDAPKDALTAELVERLKGHKGELLAALLTPSGEAASNARPAPDLSLFLPHVSSLKPAQRRLWRERTAAYVAQGMSRSEAEEEAMCEMVCTGKLCEG